MMTISFFAVAAVVAAFAAADVCATPPPTTVTFKISCATIDATDASCWEPHLPGAADNVLFPSGTAAKMVNADKYTPLIVGSITIAAGATVTLTGGGVQTVTCFVVQGTLHISASSGDTAQPLTPYKSDSTSPVGTDCAYVPQGFTPRVCGPGPLVIVKGSTVTIGGLYASVFAGMEVGSGASVTLTNGAFLWGNTTVRGTLDSTGWLFLHGYIYNFGTTSLAMLRSDYWHTFYVRPASIIVYNALGGLMNISAYISTDIPRYHLTLYPTYRLSLLNNGVMSFTPQYTGISSTGVDIVNAGTLRWVSQPNYGLCTQVGTAVNKGTFVADHVEVHVSSYLSEGGTLTTFNYGRFVMDSSAGPDEAVVELCRRRRLESRVSPLRIPIGNSPAVAMTNQSCEKEPCPYPLCCGKSKMCEEARCHGDGYGGGGPAVCCTDNVPCAGSSHGPYCGAGGFGWEVDVDCMKSIESVDRYEYEVALKHFGGSLPRFGRRRYELRGHSRISGTGVVAVGETITISGDVVVDHGATLRVLLEGGAVALPGRGRVIVDGVLALGIRTKLTADSATVLVRNAGELRIPRACTVQLAASANITVKHGATLHVDGQLMLEPSSSVASTVALCGGIVGRGAILGPADHQALCH